MGNKFTLGLTTRVTLIYQLKKFTLFCLSLRDLPNHDTPTLGTVQKPFVGGAPIKWFLNVQICGARVIEY